MAYFLKSGTRFRVSSKEEMDLHETLPVGTYTVKFDEQHGIYFLETIDNYELPSKIYGNSAKKARRILNTFKDRKSATGVMLTGDKGSGKTLLAELISLQGQDEGIPTLVINAPHYGEGFNSFIQSIDQPVVVIFDEFEKVYDEDAQEQMLTLLDGVYPSEKLYILTCNNQYRVNEHMKNRPGRIFYRLDFKGLDPDFVREYCEDKLVNQGHIDDICRVSMIFGSFNFDILKAMVEEMNRYGESAREAMEMLNAKPEHSGEAWYKISLEINDEVVPEDRIPETMWEGNPLTDQFYITYEPKDEPKSKPVGEDLAPWEQEVINSRSGRKAARLLFQPSDLVEMDSRTGKFLFKNRDGARMSVVRHEKATFSMWS